MTATADILAGTTVPSCPPALLRPSWVPEAGRLDVVPAGRWWDALVVPHPVGVHLVELLADAVDDALGPIICELWGPVPRAYFLIPTGSGDNSALHGAELLSSGCFVGVPGMTTRCGPGPHWLSPPDPSQPRRLVNAGALLEAFGGAR